MLSPGFKNRRERSGTPQKSGAPVGSMGIDARVRVRAGWIFLPDNRVPQQGHDKEGAGKETGRDVLCFVEGIAKSHEPGCQKGPEIAVHMIAVLSFFSMIYWVNTVGSIVYPRGYRNACG